MPAGQTPQRVDMYGSAFLGRMMSFAAATITMYPGWAHSAQCYPCVEHLFAAIAMTITTRHFVSASAGLSVVWQTWPLYLSCPFSGPTLSCHREGRCRCPTAGPEGTPCTSTEPAHIKCTHAHRVQLVAEVQAATRKAAHRQPPLPQRALTAARPCVRHSGAGSRRARTYLKCSAHQGILWVVPLGLGVVEHVPAEATQRSEVGLQSSGVTCSAWMPKVRPTLTSQADESKPHTGDAVALAHHLDSW